MENVIDNEAVRRAAQMMQARRKAHKGGRKPVFRQCLKCGKSFSAREMLKHRAQCR